MHKPTPLTKNRRLESARTPAMCFSREKRTRDSNSVRFGPSDRKVPAAYFPLFGNEPTKTPRKTASRLRRVESTFHSKKTKQWKVQTALKTRPNSPLGPARLESGHPHPSRASSSSAVQVFHQASQLRDCRTDGSADPRIGCKTHSSPAPSGPALPSVGSVPRGLPEHSPTSSAKQVTQTYTNQTNSQ
jgi:hypothetical protein